MTVSSVVTVTRLPSELKLFNSRKQSS